MNILHDKNMKEQLLSIVLCAAAVLPAASQASDWAPVPCPGSGSTMMTRWGKKVTPENAWRNYPRPQMVRAGWTNLNGLWDYAVTTNTACVSASPFDPTQTCGEVAVRGKILVPFALETPLSGVGRLLQPSEYLWYRRTIDVKKEKGRRILLHFGAVDQRCQVFIGHAEVTDTTHDEGNLPFTLDVTDFVKDGANELSVLVWDPTDGNFGSIGKQLQNPHGCMYTRMSGIWQTVWMESVPETYIRGYTVVTDIDSGVARLRFDVAGRRLPLTVAVDGVGAFGADELGEVTITLPRGFKIWSPEEPNLYSFTSTCGADEVKGYFGMRKFEKRKDAKGIWRFFLNNEPYFLVGPLDQGWWPDSFLTPPSEEAMTFDIQTLKKIGCNMMRKHIKIEPLRYYALCDRLGIIVLQDMPSGSGDLNARYSIYRRELKGMLDLLQAVPSIVMWVPYNERWGQPGAFLTHTTLDWVKRYDPTRLVDGPSGWADYEGGDARTSVGGKVVRRSSTHRPLGQCEAADAIDMHAYRGPDMHPVNERRVSFLGEYGGLGHQVKDHMWAGKGWGYGGTGDTATREGLLAAYLDLMGKLAVCAEKGLGGAVYTQTTDVELEVNGYMTYDREVLKFDAEKLAAAHRRVFEAARQAAK